MTSPVLQYAAQSPAMPASGPSLSDGYERQALGRLQGPAAQKAKDILRRLAEIATDTAEREAILAEDGEISAGTAAGPDEVPILGEGVMGVEAGVAAWEAYKIAQNAIEAAKLLAALKALAEVQVQKEKKKAKDCPGAAPSAGS